MRTTLHLLMPTYNRLHMLEGTLSRVFSQDADPALWHLTVVDNASTDETRGYLEGCAGRWRNFDFVVNERNLGLFGNLNRCMDLARTRKYMILHSDDDVDPGLVRAVLDFLERYPDVDMCFGSCRAKFEDTGELIPQWYRLRSNRGVDEVLGKNELISVLLSSASNFIFAPTVVYDRQFFNDQRLRYSEEYRYAADFDLWFRVALKGAKIGYLPEPNITCGIHSGRLSHKHADEMRMEAISVIGKHLTDVERLNDPEIINPRLAFFIKTKLWLFKSAIQMHLIPGFKTRRFLYGLLEAAAPKAGKQRSVGL